MPNKFEKISPTAWATTHARTFTDIPLSKEIFEWLEKKRAEVGQSDLATKMKETSLAIIMEARYKMADKILKEMQATQILEIASGLAQRGILLSEDPNVTYIEFDLPSVMSEKKEMVTSLLKGQKRDNLFLESGDALNMEDMNRALSHFDSNKPVYIVMEGLLRYLTFKEKEIIAANIQNILRRFGGYWITPDVSNKRALDRSLPSAGSQKRREFNNQVEKTTGMNITANLFETKEHAIQFFEKLGFKVEQRSYTEIIDKLVCPKILNIDQSEVDSLAKNGVLLVMSLK